MPHVDIRFRDIVPMMDIALIAAFIFDGVVEGVVALWETPSRSRWSGCFQPMNWLSVAGVREPSRDSSDTGSGLTGLGSSSS